MSRGSGGYVQGVGTPWDLGYPPPPVLTPGGGHQNMYGWHAHGTHPTEILSCSIQFSSTYKCK